MFKCSITKLFALPPPPWPLILGMPHHGALRCSSCHKISTFCEKSFEKRIFCHKFLIFKKLIFLIKKNHHNCLQYEKVLKISTFIFWILPNLTKYIYGWLSIEQHHKIRGKTIFHVHITLEIIHNITCIND